MASPKDIHINIRVSSKKLQDDLEQVKEDLPTGFDSVVGDRNMYTIPGVTDINKQRDEAYRIQQGSDKYHVPSRSVVLHHHRFNDPCDKDPNKHEVWQRKEEE